MPQVSAVIGNREKLDPAVYRALAEVREGGPRIRVDDIMAAGGAPGAHRVDGIEGRARAYVQVQTGCDHRCTFCVIPFGRGNSRSADTATIVDQVRHLVANGYREVVLTGVDITSWGADLPGRPRLGGLVRAILRRVPDLDRLRLSSIDAIEADPDLVAAIAGEARLMPHLHLSLQSGDDMILKRMKRRHLRDDAIRFCADLRAARPDIVLGADLIAGFPTETDAMFDNTLSLVDDCGLTFLHVFPFSARPGTPAARMPACNPGVVRERAARLREKGKAARARTLAAMVGKRCDVLVEKPDFGRTPHFIGVRVAAATPAARPGTIVPVDVTGLAGGDLVGSPAGRQHGDLRPAARRRPAPVTA